MKVFGATIADQTSEFLKDALKDITSLETANQKMQDAFGILQFFDTELELKTFNQLVSSPGHPEEDPGREAYGDFQTNETLAHNATRLLVSKNISPDIVIEPTCGKGSFVIAALRNFKHIKYVFAVEIYKPYVWETKFNIVDFFLANPQVNKPEIAVVHSSVFEFDFAQIANNHATKEVLIIGNPPWVTNSKLGTLNSTNLPAKTNFKNHRGLDAMTGKGNFDIGECITLIMIRTFQRMKGNVLLLTKNSVIRNIVFDQYKNPYDIASVEKYCIDTKKEFSVSVGAALLYCQLNAAPACDCTEFDFDTNQTPRMRFGWIAGKFVSNMDSYLLAKEIDGVCPFIWRQGMKHDCSKIMELDKENGHYVNQLNEVVKLEEGLVFGLLKSADLKNEVTNPPRKYTIVTQQKIGQDTRYIQSHYPKTYQYLSSHRSYFEERKSSIYRNKPMFSIFGIGEYSFKPYKVAISGLYKTFHFTLILPWDNKPVILDDTCYLIGFDAIESAVYSLLLLNTEKTTRLLQAITFSDAKRPFTKEVLMRIDLCRLAATIDTQDVQAALAALNKKYRLRVKFDLWDDFVSALKPVTHELLPEETD